MVVDIVAEMTNDAIGVTVPVGYCSIGYQPATRHAYVSIVVRDFTSRICRLPLVIVGRYMSVAASL